MEHLAVWCLGAKRLEGGLRFRNHGFMNPRWELEGKEEGTLECTDRMNGSVPPVQVIAAGSTGCQSGQKDRATDFKAG